MEEGDLEKAEELLCTRSVEWASSEAGCVEHALYTATRARFCLKCEDGTDF